MFKEILKNRKYKHIQYPKKDRTDLSRKKPQNFQELKINQRNKTLFIRLNSKLDTHKKRINLEDRAE